MDMILGKKLKEIYDRNYRSLPECKTCLHRDENHYANCIECCPVRSQSIPGDEEAFNDGAGW